MHLYRAPLWKHLDLTMRNQQKSIRVYCNAMHNWPTILMHLAAPKSLMKRTQNRAVNKVTLHINLAQKERKFVFGWLLLYGNNAFWQ